MNNQINKAVAAALESYYGTNKEPTREGIIHAVAVAVAPWLTSTSADVTVEVSDDLTEVVLRVAT